MNTANLNGESHVISDGMDSSVLRHQGAGIQGGRTLDTEGFAPEVVKAGHVVIRDTETGAYKPMPVNADGKTYAALPANHEYVGVVVASQPANCAMCAIMYDGEVNDLASPYPVDGIKAAMKTALPKLVFMHD